MMGEGKGGEGGGGKIRDKMRLTALQVLVVSRFIMTFTAVHWSMTRSATTHNDSPKT